MTLLVETDNVTRERLKEYLAAAEALLDSMNAAVGANVPDLVKHAGYRTYMRKYNDLLLAVKKHNLLTLDFIFDSYKMDLVDGAMDTTIVQQKDLFDGCHANLSILKASLENKLGVKSDKIQSLRDFLQTNLRKAIDSPPEKEKEVQKAMETLLIGRGFQKGIDYDREVGRVKVSIKEFVPDFIFPKLDLAVEIKLSKDKQKSKEIVDEINADIVGYGKAYSSVLFIVYDLGSIQNETEFKQDLETPEGVSVIIVKH